jgi:putative peptide zinc metalloprotease protein
MSNPRDMAVRELAGARVRLRPEIRLSIREFSDGAGCVLEDPASGRFHRTGLREHAFIRHLDGTLTLHEALARMAADTGEDALAEHEAISVLQWLLETGLAVTSESTRADALFEKAQKKKSRSLLQLTNLLSIKIPLANPERFFAAVDGKFRGWLGRPLFLLWCVVGVLGLSQVVWNRDRLGDEFEGVLGSDNWLWLGLAWVFLKVVHECAHGLACKRFGGHVPEAGVILILFVPMGYVDATSSWRFASRWDRMMVGAAGMYVELFIAAVAALVWAQTDPGVVHQVAFSVMFMASATTLLFNANPLMRFDGYYILSDWLEIPNLYARATSLVWRTLRRYLLSDRKEAKPDWKSGMTWFFLVYGTGALVWKVLVWVTLAIAASRIAQGAGVVLVLISLVTMLVGPLKKAAQWVGERSATGWVGMRPMLLRVGLALAGLVVLLAVPLRLPVHAPAVLDFDDESIIRVECPGFVKRVHVRPGQKVRKGTLLFTLENPDEQIKVRQLETELKRSEVRLRQLQSEGDAARYTMEQSRFDGLQGQIKEMRSYLLTLRMTAPSDGILVARRLDELEGTFVSRGTELASISDPLRREVKVVVSEDEIEHFRAQVDFPISVKVSGRGGSFEGVLERVEPQASRQPPHLALTAAAGGPLPVQRARQQNKEKDGESYELVEPAFKAVVKLKGRLEESLYAGELARVRFWSRKGESLGKAFYSRVSRWTDHLVRQAEGEG